MMKFLAAAALVAMSVIPAVSSAEEIGTSSITMGLVQTNLSLLDEGTIHGVNLKYQYEQPGSRLGFVGSVTWSSGDDTIDRDGRSLDMDMSYYSLALGPSWRVAQPVSVYALLGASGANAKTEGGTRVSDHFEPVVGVGARVFINKLVIDAYYEKAFSHKSDRFHTDADSVSLGLGYAFDF